MKDNTFVRCPGSTFMYSFINYETGFFKAFPSISRKIGEIWMHEPMEDNISIADTDIFREHDFSNNMDGFYPISFLYSFIGHQIHCHGSQIQLIII